MFERFTHDARRAVKDAVDVARETGATSVEAEHLLLALTRGETSAAAALRGCGLDYDTLSSALERETERSLAAVGVSADAPEFSPYVGAPRLATSAKVALEGALRVAVQRSDRRLDAGHLVLALLRPDRGTLPRALELADMDRESLRGAVQASM
jgi:ATP-dependent Clp protease ATP-binding subunit ClpA